MFWGELFFADEAVHDGEMVDAGVVHFFAGYDTSNSGAA